MAHYASETYFNNGKVEVRIEKNGVTEVLLTGENARILEDKIDKVIMFDDYDALQDLLKNWREVLRTEYSKILGARGSK